MAPDHNPGKQLKKLRKERGLSLREVARRKIGRGHV
mgnify:CR=1 FL=1